MSDDVLCRIPPFHYVHVFDRNSCLTRLEIGPKNLMKLEQETITVGPEKMISIPPGHYSVIESPVVRDKQGQVVFDHHGQAKLKHGDIEMRFHQAPFPLYPGERLISADQKSQ